jgi:hypothetical protein
MSDSQGACPFCGSVYPPDQLAAHVRMAHPRVSAPSSPAPTARPTQVAPSAPRPPVATGTYLLIWGIAFQAIAGVILGISLSKSDDYGDADPSGGGLVFAAIIGGIGGTLLTLGLIAVGVRIGLRDAKSLD